MNKLHTQFKTLFLTTSFVGQYSNNVKKASNFFKATFSLKDRTQFYDTHLQMRQMSLASLAKTLRHYSVLQATEEEFVDFADKPKLSRFKFMLLNKQDAAKVWKEQKVNIHRIRTNKYVDGVIGVAHGDVTVFSSSLYDDGPSYVVCSSFPVASGFAMPLVFNVYWDSPSEDELTLLVGSTLSQPGWEVYPMTYNIHEMLEHEGQ